MRQDSSITEIKGIGEKTKKLFEKMGVYTVGDILLHFPRNYIQYPHPVPIDEMTAEHMQTEDKLAIVARIERTPVTRSGRHMQVTLLVIGSPGHQIQLIWYRMPYIRNTLTHGKYFVFYGNVHIKDGKFVMEQPVVYTPEAYQEIENCFLPVYTLTSGITNNLMIKTMRQALDEEELLTDFLPGEIRTRRKLCEYNYAVKQIHFPDTMECLIEARKRLVFDEFFLFIMGMQYQKEKRTRQENRFVMEHPEFVEDLIQKLPYELTGAQRRALHDVTENMQGPYAMQRLIQGDVGSGKTILAFLAMAWCAQNGYQSAIMAPTEVLAQQHYETFQKLCEQFGLHFPVILLTGSMTAKQKRSAYERLELYENALIVGTHALIQEKPAYANLALVITDEQHRFGVRQREEFAQKGDMPHILVMSATPIPRTLAIIIYGDMDISVVDEVPARRLPIKNCVVNTAYRPKAYAFVADEVKKGLCRGLIFAQGFYPALRLAALPQQGAAPLAPLRGYPCTPTKTVHPPLASVPFLRVLLSYPGGDTHSHLPLEHRHCEPRKRQISRCRSRLPKRRKADKRMGRNDPRLHPQRRRCPYRNHAAAPCPALFL